MKDTDMHVVNALKTGEFEVLDCYSTGYKAPDSDTIMSGNFDIKDIKKENDSGDFITISYTRNIDTKDKFDFILKPVIDLNKKINYYLFI
jgi:hypothetical protein